MKYRLVFFFFFKEENASLSCKLQPMVSCCGLNIQVIESGSKNPPNFKRQTITRRKPVARVAQVFIYTILRLQGVCKFYLHYGIRMLLFPQIYGGVTGAHSP